MLSRDVIMERFDAFFEKWFEKDGMPCVCVCVVVPTELIPETGGYAELWPNYLVLINGDPDDKYEQLVSATAVLNRASAQHKPVNTRDIN